VCKRLLWLLYYTPTVAYSVGGSTQAMCYFAFFLNLLCVSPRNTTKVASLEVLACISRDHGIPFRSPLAPDSPIFPKGVSAKASFLYIARAIASVDSTWADLEQVKQNVGCRQPRCCVLGRAVWSPLARGN
jgi:hypothetical protein